MPIHLIIYKERREFQNSEVIWEIGDSAIEHLLPTFNRYNQKTGYLIDEYSDNNFASENLQLLKEVISETLNDEIDQKIRSTLKKLLKCIRKAEKEKSNLAFIGE